MQRRVHALGLERDDEQVQELCQIEQHQETAKREVRQPVRGLVDVRFVDRLRDVCGAMISLRPTR